jgi:AmmeMemoRadiSam system protein B
MNINWYPKDKFELNSLLDKFLDIKKTFCVPHLERRGLFVGFLDDPRFKTAKLRPSSKELGFKSRDIKQKEFKNIHGIIVPHAGYEYSGQIAAKAYNLLKDLKYKKAILLAPSHYKIIDLLATSNKNTWETPLGSVDITENEFPKENISKEHAIDNQIPFLQKLNFKEILPLLIGQIDMQQAKTIAKKLVKLDGIFIISTDLSHFLPYEEAIKSDNKILEAIQKLDSKKLKKIDNSACGIFPLMIMNELCKIKKWKPKLIEYKNSGDVTGDKSSVVGYASLVF